jgi:hypothetical protein
MLPQLFAININPSRYDDSDSIPETTTGRIAIFQARPCHDGRGGGGRHHDPWILHDIPQNIYRISPYRIHMGSGQYEDRVSAFILEGRFGYSTIQPDGPVILYSEERGPPSAHHLHSGYYDDYCEGVDERSSIYRGHWRYSGNTVFSMYCATPIPILVFTGRERGIVWPTPNYNRISVAEGDRIILRVWVQRWNPANWDSAIEDAYAARAVIPIPVHPPKFITDLIIADAIAKGGTCSITMEPLKIDKVTVTPCYHLFDTDALNAWTATQVTGETVCPQCRKPLGGRH